MSGTASTAVETDPANPGIEKIKAVHPRPIPLLRQAVSRISGCARRFSLVSPRIRAKMCRKRVVSGTHLQLFLTHAYPDPRRLARHCHQRMCLHS